MGKSKNLEQPPEQPHKIHYEDENLVIFFQRKYGTGGLYLGYHKALGVWYPRAVAFAVLERWYESTEASRLKTAAGVTDKPRDENRWADAKIHEEAILALTWLTDGWGRTA